MPKSTFLLSKVCKSSPFCVILRENRRFLCRSGMYLYNNRAKKKRAGNKSDSFFEMTKDCYSSSLSDSW